jgi:serine phosphatase RsbU (regulator of sigma subunit)
VIIDERCLELLPGDRIVLFSDGMIDANSPDGLSFGRDRLASAVAESGASTAEGLCDHVFGLVERFQANSEQFDDMALLVAIYGGR